MRKHLLLGVLVVLTMTHSSTAQTRAFIGAHIIPIDGQEIEHGTLIIEDGQILAIGSAAEIEIPLGAERHNANGMVIMPGLVDTHSHVGQVEGGDGSAPIQPDVRVIDSINPRDSGFQKAQSGGVTTANIMSGSGHLLSGQTLYVKYRDADVIDDLLILDGDGNWLGGIKMANGTNPRRNAPFPGTRAKAAALVRAEYIKASEYGAKKAEAAKAEQDAPPLHLGYEALLDAMSGKKVVHHHTHRHDDILTVLRLSEEFGFRVVLHHVSDAWKVADEIAAAGAGVSLISVDSPGGKLEAKDNHFKSGRMLEQAGALVGFHTDDGITDSRFFLRQAALAVRAGMSREKALFGMTLAGAEMIDLDDRIGSLTPGKDADFIVLSGDPLSVYTHVQETWIDGERVFDRSNAEDRKYATGGYGTGNDQATFIHLLEREAGQ
ncbi:MAG: amidohydrolase family protein [Bacteroidetes Order II. Incertae sedis bacterium]|jgi:imidazolonepropionase-like amidohydrolase|nr:amidohydrolase family protein [Bacteroidetes Order II. bacterium]MBT5250742.1 amidohydrolase family protein [Bacteroidetes Order II. bacterium]MBT6199117.1 amidohydrolase family protein [Bacteroidetes Order II. bacterium]MBT6599711.1 amidohydrolase family protein [Bacteroidetes Order II. bacterium]MBT7400228.1 amidohydrolase family protein [Bacteroidetes Order II. bacterium]